MSLRAPRQGRTPAACLISDVVDRGEACRTFCVQPVNSHCRAIRVCLVVRGPLTGGSRLVPLLRNKKILLLLLLLLFEKVSSS